MTPLVFSLPKILTPSSLQRLLSSLVLAESVRFVAEPPGLVVRCESDDGSVGNAVSDGLTQQAIAWHVSAVGVHYRAEQEWQLFRHADAVLTMIIPPGGSLPGELLATLAEWGVELRAIRRLSPLDHSIELALEFYLDGWQSCQTVRPALAQLSMRWEVDLVLAPSGSKLPRRRLIAFDMDSTLIECEVIDELARRAGCGDEVAAVTRRAMRGELDFRSSFRERLGKLRGLDSAEIQAVAARLPLMSGARSLLRTLRAQGHYTVILSGGFDVFARQLQRLLNVDEVHANHLQIEDGKLTGVIEGELVDAERKVQLLGDIAAAQGFAMQDTVAVGDGANDLPMLAAAGLGVAFHAKPLVQTTAPAAINHGDLNALLYVLGVPRGSKD